MTKRLQALGGPDGRNFREAALLTGTHPTPPCTHSRSISTRSPKSFDAAVQASATFHEELQVALREAVATLARRASEEIPRVGQGRSSNNFFIPPLRLNEMPKLQRFGGSVRFRWRCPIPRCITAGFTPPLQAPLPAEGKGRFRLSYQGTWESAYRQEDAGGVDCVSRSLIALATSKATSG
jgi:hypothetical protein